MKINNYVTYIHTPEDIVYLKSKLLPVSIRLFESSAKYRLIIMEICDYIKFMTLAKPEDYKLPHGMSGANLAIPFNIIGYAKNRGKDNAKCIIMINPRLIAAEGDTIETQSNCGSIRLEKPITVNRREDVLVEYYDENGNKHENWFKPSTGSFTIQHEIDHNNGILITDYLNL